MAGARVQLSEEQSESLKKLAAERGQSLTRLVGDAVNRYLHEQKIRNREGLRRRAPAAGEAFRCDEEEYSIAHDEFFADDCLQ